MTCLFWAIIALLATVFVMSFWLLYNILDGSSPDIKEEDYDMFYPTYKKEENE